ncbi:hypothetical protein ACAF76_006190 [Brevibacillus sp. TJ4]|uniref:hypothetical protein n=1 Tax=Brevibacillus sp. TJ4 TaxID=3234853 RepID=UPI0037D1B259
MNKFSKIFLLPTLFASLLFIDNGSAFAKSTNSLNASEMDRLKNVFKFSDEHIADLIEDGEIDEYLSMEKPVVSKNTDYFELTEDKSGKISAKKLTKSEFKEKVEKMQQKNKKKEKKSKSTDGLVSTMDYDINDDHDYITLETWFIYDEEDWDAQASARFEFADNSSSLGFTKKLYDDFLGIGVSSNARLNRGTEEYYLKYKLYGFDGEYDKYGNPIYEWYSVTKRDDSADVRDANGYGFNVNFPSLDDNRKQYIKNIRGYMKVEVEPEGRYWDGKRYDIFSHYLHLTKKIKLSSLDISFEGGGGISFDYEDKVEKITGHVYERIDDR